MDLEQHKNNTVFELFSDNKENNTEKKENHRHADFNSGYRGELIRILLTAGTISYKGLHMLNGYHYMYTKKLKQMREEGLTSTVHLGTRRAERLKAFHKTKNMYDKKIPAEYLEFFQTYVLHKAYKYIGSYDSEKTRAERAYRESEVFLISAGAGIRIFPEEKPLLFKNESLPKDDSMYFSSTEVKSYGEYQFSPQSKKTGKETKINSRAVGVIISGMEQYVLYHTGKRQLKWNYTSEHQFVKATQRLLFKSTDWIPADHKVDSCILFYQSNEVVEKIFQLSEKNQSLLNVNSGYAKIYPLPYDENGKKMLRLMVHPGWKQELLNSYLEESYQKDVYKSNIVCDGKNNEIRYLLFCIPDLVRLYKFIEAAKWSGIPDNYVIICFEHQINLIKALSKGTVKIRAANLDEYIKFITCN